MITPPYTFLTTKPQRRFISTQHPELLSGASAGASSVSAVSTAHFMIGKKLSREISKYSQDAVKLI